MLLPRSLLRARCPCWALHPPAIPSHIHFPFHLSGPRGLRISSETVCQQGSVSKCAFQSGWALLHLSEVSPPQSPNSSSHAHGDEQVKWGAGDLGKDGRWQPWPCAQAGISITDFFSSPLIDIFFFPQSPWGCRVSRDCMTKHTTPQGM